MNENNLQNEINHYETETKKETSKYDSKTISSIQGDDVEKQEWVDHGVIDVNVKDLPMPENVNSKEDFNHHINWNDAESATKEMPQIQNEVKEGKTREDFQKYDQQNGLGYTQGKERVYDLYYGSDPITLDKVGDQYTIISGRHRIFAAKELGIETIPARVKEKVNE